MKVDQILKKIGVTLVRVEKNKNRETLILYLRINRSERTFQQWRAVVEEVLLAADENVAKKLGWKIDVSQYYYVSPEKAVRYLWRAILTGNVRAGAEALGQAVLRVVSQGTDVTSMPLVGRKQYAFDPAAGRMKGAHDPRDATAIVSQGIGVSGELASE